MTRYVRLYLYFLRFSFSKAMEFRVDFFFRVVMDLAFYGVGLSFFTVLYGHTRTLVDWDIDQIYIFISGFFLVDAIHMTVFANNLWMFPFYVNRGELDYYLVRPVSTLFFISTREFAANSFLNLIIASGILAWALRRYPEPLGAGSIALYIGLLLVGALLYWMLYLIFLLPVFWTHEITGMRQLVFNLQHFAERPHRIFHGWVGRVLLNVLPYALVTSVPTTFLFEGMTFADAAHYAAVVAGVFAVLLLLWRLGLRAYASASS